ncbi:MAG: hydroxymethylglutaryl-CoA synthase [Bacteroidota bacterium]
MGVLNKRVIGIDDMTAHIPKIYLPIETLAQARNIEYAKLNKGLGLTNMALADVHEDVATMAANAVLQIISQNQLHPKQIGRIYVGTESSVDGSKPMATYVLEMLSAYYEEAYGPDCFLNCDVVDLTFACIGSIDAMHNTLDWVRAGSDRIGIIVGSDIAKYELDSTGEYTQGAGAVALLIKENPRLLAISEHWGTATRGVHDFFKPLRRVSKMDIINEVLQLVGTGVASNDIILRLQALNGQSILNGLEEQISIHKETPVFDGPYSNDCYQERIGEALAHFSEQASYKANEPVTDNWRRLVFHLPYAFQARRMFSEVFFKEAQKRGDWNLLKAELGLEIPEESAFEVPEDYKKAYGKFLRAISKTERYRTFVKEKIAKGEWASSHMGNLYTSSLFLSLMSTLELDLKEDTDLTGSHFGFFGYGSGSKSKVFEGAVQKDWKTIVERFQLQTRLEDRSSVEYDDYEKLHRGQLENSIHPVDESFSLAAICQEKGVQEGSRTYQWQAKARVTTMSE